MSEWRDKRDKVGWRLQPTAPVHFETNSSLSTRPRDLRQGQGGVRPAHGSWLRLSFVYNHYLFFACTLVVLLAIVLYLLRIHRIHRRQTRASAPLDLLWIEQVVPMIGVQVGP